MDKADSPAGKAACFQRKEKLVYPAGRKDQTGITASRSEESSRGPCPVVQGADYFVAGHFALLVFGQAAVRGRPKRRIADDEIKGAFAELFTRITDVVRDYPKGPVQIVFRRVLDGDFSKLGLCLHGNYPSSLTGCEQTEPNHSASGTEISAKVDGSASAGEPYEQWRVYGEPISVVGLIQNYPPAKCGIAGQLHRDVVHAGHFKEKWLNIFVI